MRINELIAGFDVEYSEHQNKWRLYANGADDMLLEKDTLRELRIWVDAQEKKAVKEKYQKRAAFFYDSSGYGVAQTPVQVTVTGTGDTEHEFWISYEDDHKAKRRAKVRKQKLFMMSNENCALVARAAADKAQAEGLLKAHTETLKKLAPFI